VGTVLDFRLGRLRVFLRADIEEMPVFERGERAEEVVGLPDGIGTGAGLAHPEIEAAGRRAMAGRYRQTSGARQR